MSKIGHINISAIKRGVTLSKHKLTVPYGVDTTIRMLRWVAVCNRCDIYNIPSDRFKWEYEDDVGDIVLLDVFSKLLIEGEMCTYFDSIKPRTFIVNSRDGLL